MPQPQAGTEHMRKPGPQVCGLRAGSEGAMSPLHPQGSEPTAGPSACILRPLHQGHRSRFSFMCVLNVSQPQVTTPIPFEANELAYQQFFSWCPPVLRNARFKKEVFGVAPFNETSNSVK